MRGPARGLAAVGVLVCAAGLCHGQLYSNGPVLTSSNACTVPPAGTISQLQLANTTFGFGTQPAISGRVADDWSVPPGNGWSVTGFVFYGYQTFGTSSAATIASVTLRIWNGPPGQAGSSVVVGDTITNRLQTASFAAVYRVAPAGTDCGLDRPVYALVCAIPAVTLPPGQYWVDWQAAGNGQLPSGPWAVPVTITGQAGAPGANARGTNSSLGEWVPLTDFGSHAAQDLAFQVLGSVVQTCYANCDGSTMPPALNVLDFSCYLNSFTAGSSYANCDKSTQPPVLNAQDFICFLNAFNSGCSSL